MPSTFHIGFRLHQQAAFPNFNLRMADATSVKEMTSSSFPKSIVSHVSVGAALSGINKSSKYLLHREKIFFSSLRMLSGKSLIEVCGT